MVFNQHPLSCHAPSLAQQQRWILRVMQNVRKQNCVKPAVREWNCRAIKYFDWDVGVISGEDVQPSDVKIGPFGTNRSRQQAIAASNVEYASVSGCQLCEPRR